VFEEVTHNPRLRQAAEALAVGRPVRLSGVWGSAASLVSAAIGHVRGAPVLLVTAHTDDADEAADDVEVLAGEAGHLFPAWEVDVGSDHLNDEIAAQRQRICNCLLRVGQGSDTAPAVLVAPVMALLQPAPSKDALQSARRALRRGDETSPEELAAWLTDAGFEHVEQVDQHGQFARRGGIVDIFAPGAEQAIRAEFFADQIDSIRRFDLDTQRSTEEVDHVDLTALTAAGEIASGEVTSLFAYLPAGTVVCIVEPEEVFDLAEQFYARSREFAEPVRSGLLRYRAQDVFDGAAGFAVVEMHRFRPTGQTDAIPLGIRSLERLAVNAREALAELEEISDVAQVWVYCENPAERERFLEVLAGSHKKLAERVRSAIGHVHSGFYWPDQRLVVVGHHEIYHRYAQVRRIRRVRAGRPVDSLLDLQAGDYVVHVAHGVGRFEGLRQMDHQGRREEYLRLRFAGNAVLHVPAARIDLVQKYIGSGRRRPSLSRLGGSQWQRQKQRVAEAVRDMAADMLRIQAMRQSMPGIAYPESSEWQKQFAEEFIYTETEDQIATMGQIHSDMKQPRPMDRLLCGDVGYGKTELAMRAAFKVAETGKQVAVLVPTTVLAAQHFRTFTERMADYPFRIEVLSRFRTPSQQARIIESLAAGRLDIVIGTHRLLSGDVRFADLGLVVIDEEQRFGVEHKERLKSMRATIDVLTMTATPIPRTLHMALLGLRDISSLATPPLDRRAIHTEVCHYDDRLIRTAILRELNRQGQVFFVHNRVYNIQSMADHVRSLVPEARVAVAHGRMPESQLEETMVKFVTREIDVLVCTTIIESGLDIPTANSMIVHEADRFGLAELHQLRGRVGRYKHRAFCYLLLPERRPVGREAAKRLKAIEEFSDLGAGFQIAMRDLEIRGAGNILGREQSGHIAAVGYELYCQLLQRAVDQLRGTETPPRREVHVDIGADAYIPHRYVPSQRQRMELYRRLTRCRSREELEQLDSDLADAYGPVPQEIRTLLGLAELRLLAGGLEIDSIVASGADVTFAVRDLSAVEPLFKDAPGSARVPDPGTVYWRPPPPYLEMPTLLNVLIKRFRGAAVAV